MSLKKPSAFLFLGAALLAGTKPLLAGPCDETNGVSPSLVNQWERWQMPLTSTKDYARTTAAQTGNPYRTILLRVTYTNCSTGQQIKGYGFWDQQKAYYIRGAFPAGPGTQSATWQWVTSCSGNTVTETADCSGDSGLHNRKGRITVLNNTSTNANPLYKNGFPRILSGTAQPPYFTYYNTNRKLFWLGDTAWAASMAASSSGDWQSYVNDRSGPGPGSTTRPSFTLVQMAPAPMWAGKRNGTALDLLNGIPADQAGRRPFEQLCTNANNPPNSCSRWLSDYWTEFDKKVQAANKAGLIVFLAGVMNPLGEDGGSAVIPQTADALVFTRNVVARLFGNGVIYSPGFDAKPTSAYLSLIKSVGCALQEASCVVGPPPAGSSCSNPSCSSSWHLVTNHPGGGSTQADLQNLTPLSWLNFQMIQSSACVSACKSTALPEPVAQEMACQLQCVMNRARDLIYRLPTKAKVNGEAIYEGGLGFGPNGVDNYSPYRVRQTAYLSMLSGAVGYSLGVCGLTEWGCGPLKGCTGAPRYSPSGALERDSSKQARWLRQHFQTVYWEKLKPEPDRILVQAPDSQQEKKFAVATDGVSAVLAYVPDEQLSIQLNFKKAAGDTVAIPELAAAKISIPTTWTVRWLSPRTGREYGPGANSIISLDTTAGGKFLFNKPACLDPQISCDRVDWLLRITKNGTTPPLPGLISNGQLQAWLGVDTSVDEPRIFLQAVDNSGNPTAAETMVTGAPWAALSSPRIARESIGGNSLVVWQSDEQDGDQGGIYARLYGATGDPLGPEFRVNTTRVGDQAHPYVAAVAGRFVVVWASQTQEDATRTILAQVYESSGKPVGSESLVSCSSGDYPQAGPGPLETIQVAWESLDGSAIYTRSIDLLGNPQSPQSLAASAADNSTYLALESIGVRDSSTQTGVNWQSYGSDFAAAAAAGTSFASDWTTSLCEE